MLRTWCCLAALLALGAASARAAGEPGAKSPAAAHAAAPVAKAASARFGPFPTLQGAQEFAAEWCPYPLPPLQPTCIAAVSGNGPYYVTITPLR